MQGASSLEHTDHEKHPCLTSGTCFSLQEKVCPHEVGKGTEELPTLERSLCLGWAAVTPVPEQFCRQLSGNAPLPLGWPQFSCLLAGVLKACFQSGLLAKLN